MPDIVTLIAFAAATASAPTCTQGSPAATEALRTADAASRRHEPRAADAALDAGLQALGHGYAAPPTADDTGMHLVLAESEKHRGRLAAAIAIKRRVLAERLDLCRRQSR